MAVGEGGVADLDVAAAAAAAHSITCLGAVAVAVGSAIAKMATVTAGAEEEEAFLVGEAFPAEGEEEGILQNRRKRAKICTEHQSLLSPPPIHKDAHIPRDGGRGCALRFNSC